MKMRFLRSVFIPFVFLTMTWSMPGSAAIDSDLNAVIEFVLTGQLTESMNSDRDLARGICEASGESLCFNLTVAQAICKASGVLSGCWNASIAEAICTAGGAILCTGVSVGEAICRAGDAILCTNVSPAEGLCRARKGTFCQSISLSKALALPVVDTDWAWDRFTHPNTYQQIWACRGKSTGQFADEFRCLSKPKHDLTWPNY